MPRFDEMSDEERLKINAKGGKASGESRRKQAEEVEGMDFEEIVNTFTTGKDLWDLYRGLMASGKKGSVKATETILKYLDKKKEDAKSEFEL